MLLRLEAKETDAQQLSFFRIAFSIFCIFQAFAVYQNLFELYGINGLINSEIADAFLINVFFHPNIQHFYAYFNTILTPDQFTNSVFFSYLLCLMGMLIGVKTRLMAVFAWVLHLVLMNSALHFSYGVEQFTKIGLFYCVVFPTNRFYSVDNRKGSIPTKGMIPTLSLKLLQAHLCVVYFFAGIGKLGGQHWLNGEAIWRSIEQPQFQQFEMGWISAYPELLQIAGWSVIFIEMTYPIFINIKKTRLLTLIAVISLHLGIAIFMGLRYFAAVMIILNISAYGFPILASWLRRAKTGKQGMDRSLS